MSLSRGWQWAGRWNAPLPGPANLNRAQTTRNLQTFKRLQQQRPGCGNKLYSATALLWPVPRRKFAPESNRFKPASRTSPDRPSHSKRRASGRVARRCAMPKPWSVIRCRCEGRRLGVARSGGMPKRKMPPDAGRSCGAREDFTPQQPTSNLASFGIHPAYYLQLLAINNYITTKSEEIQQLYFRFGIFI